MDALIKKLNPSRFPGMSPFMAAVSVRDHDVVHIDEGHELDKRQQTALYLALDKRRLLVRSGTGRRPQEIPLADFTLLVSTTDEYKLLQPLRDRMRLNLRFQFYAPTELVEVARQRIAARSYGNDDGACSRHGSILTVPEKLEPLNGSPSSIHLRNVHRGLLIEGNVLLREVESWVERFY